MEKSYSVKLINTECKSNVNVVQYANIIVTAIILDFIVQMHVSLERPKLLTSDSHFPNSSVGLCTLLHQACLCALENFKVKLAENPREEINSIHNSPRVSVSE